MRPRKWTEQDLRSAVLSSRSVRQVLQKLGLVEAGGNYEQVKYYLSFYKISASHFSSRGWRRDSVGSGTPHKRLVEILVRGSRFQSYKLKKRLFSEKIKEKCCELCGWAQLSEDGRLPLELDHINGDRYDNRLQNLRILCPNCHSLQSTHRGKNKKKG